MSWDGGDGVQDKNLYVVGGEGVEGGGREGGEGGIMDVFLNYVYQY